MTFDGRLKAGLASQQLTTIKRQRDASSRDVATVTAKLHKVRDENAVLRSILTALRDSLQVLRSSILELVSI